MESIQVKEKSLVKSLNNIDKIGPLCLASQQEIIMKKQHLQKISNLVQKFPYIRQINEDQNAFYRALFFYYIEQLLIQKNRNIFIQQLTLLIGFCKQNQETCLFDHSTIPVEFQQDSMKISEIFEELVMELLKFAQKQHNDMIQQQQKQQISNSKIDDKFNDNSTTSYYEEIPITNMLRDQIQKKPKYDFAIIMCMRIRAMTILQQFEIQEHCQYIEEKSIIQNFNQKANDQIISCFPDKYGIAFQIVDVKNDDSINDYILLGNCSDQAKANKQNKLTILYIEDYFFMCYSEAILAQIGYNIEHLQQIMMKKALIQIKKENILKSNLFYNQDHKDDKKLEQIIPTEQQIEQHQQVYNNKNDQNILSQPSNQEDQLNDSDLQLSKLAEEMNYEDDEDQEQIGEQNKGFNNLLRRANKLDLSKSYEQKFEVIQERVSLEQEAEEEEKKVNSTELDDFTQLRNRSSSESQLKIYQRVKNPSNLIEEFEFNQNQRLTLFSCALPRQKEFLLQLQQSAVRLMDDQNYNNKQKQNEIQQVKKKVYFSDDKRLIKKQIIRNIQFATKMSLLQTNKEITHQQYNQTFQECPAEKYLACSNLWQLNQIIQKDIDQIEKEKEIQNTQQQKEQLEIEELDQKVKVKDQELEYLVQEREQFAQKMQELCKELGYQDEGFPIDFTHDMDQQQQQTTDLELQQAIMTNNFFAKQKQQQQEYVQQYEMLKSKLEQEKLEQIEKIKQQHEESIQDLKRQNNVLQEENRQSIFQKNILERRLSTCVDLEREEYEAEKTEYQKKIQSLEQQCSDQVKNIESDFQVQFNQLQLENIEKLKQAEKQMEEQQNMLLSKLARYEQEREQLIQQRDEKFLLKEQAESRYQQLMSQFENLQQSYQNDQQEIQQLRQIINELQNNQENQKLASQQCQEEDGEELQQKQQEQIIRNLQTQLDQMAQLKKNLEDENIQKTEELERLQVFAKDLNEQFTLIQQDNNQLKDALDNYKLQLETAQTRIQELEELQITLINQENNLEKLQHEKQVDAQTETLSSLQQQNQGQVYSEITNIVKEKDKLIQIIDENMADMKEDFQLVKEELQKLKLELKSVYELKQKNAPQGAGIVQELREKLQLEQEKVQKMRIIIEKFQQQQQQQNQMQEQKQRQQHPQNLQTEGQMQSNDEGTSSNIFRRLAFEEIDVKQPESSLLDPDYSQQQLQQGQLSDIQELDEQESSFKKQNILRNYTSDQPLHRNRQEESAIQNELTQQQVHGNLDQKENKKISRQNQEQMDKLLYKIRNELTIQQQENNEKSQRINEQDEQLQKLKQIISTIQQEKSQLEKHLNAYQNDKQLQQFKKSSIKSKQLKTPTFSDDTNISYHNYQSVNSMEENEINQQQLVFEAQKSNTYCDQEDQQQQIYNQSMKIQDEYQEHNNEQNILMELFTIELEDNVREMNKNLILNLSQQNSLLKQQLEYLNKENAILKVSVQKSVNECDQFIEDIRNKYQDHYQQTDEKMKEDELLQEIYKLNTKCEQYQQEISQYKILIQREMNDSVQKFQEKSQENLQLLNKCETMQLEIDMLRKQRQEGQSECGQLQVEIGSKLKDIQSLQSQFQENSAEALALKKQLQVNQESNNQQQRIFQNEILNLNKKIEQLMQDNNNLNLLYQQKENKCQELALLLQEKEVDLQAISMEIQQKNQQALAQEKRSRDELAQMKLIGEQSEARNEEMKTIIETQCRNLEKLKQQNESLNTQLQGKERIIDSKDNITKKLQNQLDLSSKEIATLKTEKQEAEIKAEKVKNQLNKQIIIILLFLKFLEELKTVKSELEKEQKSCQQYSIKLENLNKQVSEYSIRLGAQEVTLQEQEKNQVEYREDLAKTINLLEESKKLAEKRQQEKEGVQNVLMELAVKNKEIEQNLQTEYGKSTKLVDQIKLLESQVSGLTQEKNQLNESIERISVEIRKKKQELEQQKVIMSEKDLSLSELKLNVDSLNNKIKVQEKQIEQKHSQLLQEQQHCVKLAEKIGEQNDEIQNLQREKQELHINSNRLQEQYRQKEDLIQKLQLEIDQKELERGLLDQEKMKLLHQIQQLMQQLSEIQKYCQQSQDQLTEKGRLLLMAQQQVEQLSIQGRDNNLLLQQINDLKKNSEQQQKKINDQELQLSLSKAEVIDLNNRIFQMQGTVSQIEVLQKALQRSNESFAPIQSQLVEKENEIWNLQMTVKRLESELQLQKQRCQEINDQFIKSNHLMEEFQYSEKRLKEEKNDEEQKRRQIEERIAKLENQLKQKEQIINEQQTQIENQEQIIKNTNQKQQEEIKKIQQQLQDKEIELGQVLLQNMHKEQERQKQQQFQQAQSKIELEKARQENTKLQNNLEDLHDKLNNLTAEKLQYEQELEKNIKIINTKQKEIDYYQSNRTQIIEQKEEELKQQSAKIDSLSKQILDYLGQLTEQKAEKQKLQDQLDNLVVKDKIVVEYSQNDKKMLQQILQNVQQKGKIQQQLKQNQQEGLQNNNRENLQQLNNEEYQINDDDLIFNNLNNQQQMQQQYNKAAFYTQSNCPMIDEEDRESSNIKKKRNVNSEANNLASDHFNSPEEQDQLTYNQQPQQQLQHAIGKQHKSFSNDKKMNLQQQYKNQLQSGPQIQGKRKERAISQKDIFSDIQKLNTNSLNQSLTPKYQMNSEIFKDNPPYNQNQIKSQYQQQQQQLNQRKCKIVYQDLCKICTKPIKNPSELEIQDQVCISCRKNMKRCNNCKQIYMPNQKKNCPYCNQYTSLNGSINQQINYETQSILDHNSQFNLNIQQEQKDYYFMGNSPDLQQNDIRQRNNYQQSHFIPSNQNQQHQQKTIIQKSNQVNQQYQQQIFQNSPISDTSSGINDFLKNENDKTYYMACTLCNNKFNCDDKIYEYICFQCKSDSHKYSYFNKESKIKKCIQCKSEFRQIGVAFKCFQCNQKEDLKRRMQESQIIINPGWGNNKGDQGGFDGISLINLRQCMNPACRERLLVNNEQQRFCDKCRQLNYRICQNQGCKEVFCSQVDLVCISCSKKVFGSTNNYYRKDHSKNAIQY